jgi:hypothetical protein
MRDDILSWSEFSRICILGHLCSSKVKNFVFQNFNEDGE